MDMTLDHDKKRSFSKNPRKKFPKKYFYIFLYELVEHDLIYHPAKFLRKWTNREDFKSISVNPEKSKFEKLGFFGTHVVVWYSCSGTTQSPSYYNTYRKIILEVCIQIQK